MSIVHVTISLSRINAFLAFTICVHCVAFKSESMHSLHLGIAFIVAACVAFELNQRGLRAAAQLGACVHLK